MGTMWMMFAFIFAAQSFHAPTLQEELQRVGIHSAGFDGAELAEPVNAASARHGESVYLDYMQVDKSGVLTGFPRVVRYDPASGMILRRELKVHDQEICCGSPDGISFTRSYALFAFHGSPSASAVIVADSELKPVLVLYGFGLQEVAPDAVIFTESMVHFAPTHAERILLADLRSGHGRELYPSAGDPLRAAFSGEHEKKMPSRDVCMATNDPCAAGMYDEDVEWTRGDRADRYVLKVNRSAVHALSKGQPPQTVLSERALYVYELRQGRWFYCGVVISESADQETLCQPNLEVKSERGVDPGGFVRKAN